MPESRCVHPTVHPCVINSLSSLSLALGFFFPVQPQEHSWGRSLKMGNKTWLPVCVFSNASGSMEGNVDMIVGRSDPHFDRNSKISTTFEWIAMEVCADIHVPPDYLTYWQFCHFCHITYNSWWSKCKRTLCWDRWKTVLGNGKKKITVWIWRKVSSPKTVSGVQPISQINATVTEYK